MIGNSANEVNKQLSTSQQTASTHTDQGLKYAVACTESRPCPFPVHYKTQQCISSDPDRSLYAYALDSSVPQCPRNPARLRRYENPPRDDTKHCGFISAISVRVPPRPQNIPTVALREPFTNERLTRRLRRTETHRADRIGAEAHSRSAPSFVVHSRDVIASAHCVDLASAHSPTRVEPCDRSIESLKRVKHAF
jgi:hypothetical protein